MSVKTPGVYCAFERRGRFVGDSFFLEEERVCTVVYFSATRFLAASWVSVYSVFLERVVGGIRWFYGFRRGVAIQFYGEAVRGKNMCVWVWT